MVSLTPSPGHAASGNDPAPISERPDAPGCLAARPAVREALNAPRHPVRLPAAIKQVTIRATVSNTPRDRRRPVRQPPDQRRYLKRTSRPVDHSNTAL